VEAKYQQFKDLGFMFIYLLAEGQVTAWASTYGLTCPVVKDMMWGVSNQYEVDNYIPTDSLLAPGLVAEMIDANYIGDNNIEDLLPEGYEPPPARDTYPNNGIVEEEPGDDDDTAGE